MECIRGVNYYAQYPVATYACARACRQLPVSAGVLCRLVAELVSRDCHSQPSIGPLIGDLHSARASPNYPFHLSNMPCPIPR
jgi:hypothetical protein